MWIYTESQNTGICWRCECALQQGIKNSFLLRVYLCLHNSKHIDDNDLEEEELRKWVRGFTQWYSEIMSSRIYIPVCIYMYFFFFSFSWYVIVNPHLGDSWEIFLVGGRFQLSNQMKISDLTTKLRYNAWDTAVLQTVLLARY